MRRTLVWTMMGYGLVAACGDETITLPERLFASVDATAGECPDGGQVILTGIDENRNGSLDDTEIQAREPVCAGGLGDPGTDGLPGTDALIRTQDELPGANCEVGGIRIDVGVDADDDEVLDEEEVQQTSFACDGPEGEVGLSSLVRLRDDPGALCADAGGIVVDTGVDENRNGTLDDAEVLSSEVVCAGEAGVSGLADITEEPPGANCTLGGNRIDAGFDQNGNGQLEPGEINETAYICDVLPTLVRVDTELAASSVECPQVGGARIESGIDDNGDGVLQAGEVDRVEFVCNQGTGLRSLVAVTAEGPGNNCPAGGQRIESGVDADDDDTLDPNEVTSTSFVCNGTDGTDANPTGGNAVRVQEELPGANCANGGLRVQTGPDTNGNGALDDAEVNSTTYTCEGAGTQALAAISDEPAGANCTNGGIRIDQGPDTNGNGVLDPAEQGTPQYVCNAIPGTQVPFLIVQEQLGPAFTVDPFSTPITAFGGAGGNYQWSVSAGMLPNGWTLDPTGTPSTTLSGPANTGVGMYTFTIRVTDFFGQTAEKAYTLEVVPPPCSPGQGGLVSENLTTLTAPISFRPQTSNLAADTSSTGWLYVMDAGANGSPYLHRFTKQSPVTEEVLLTRTEFTTIGSNVNTIDIEGNNIYITADNAACAASCVWRVSTDGGATFAVSSLATFSPPTNSYLQGVTEDAGTLYAITRGTDDVQLWAISLSPPFPNPATLLTVLPDLDICNGLDHDASYFYTVCDDIGDVPMGDGNEGLARINRTTLMSEPVAPLTVTLDTGTRWADVEVVDTDNDGAADVAYVQGDNNGSTVGDGGTYYVCDPGAAGFPAFSRPFDQGRPVDEGIAYDESTNSLWQVQEGTTNLFRYD
jgi:hypothetical protein